MFPSISFVYSADISTLLYGLLTQHLPVDWSESQRIVVRRKHIWEDALHHFKQGVNENKYLKVTFGGEPGVDDGGLLHEFFHLLLFCISRNNVEQMEAEYLG